MEVRKFEAFNMQEAVKLVKKELGADAVILSTSEKQITVAGSSKTQKVVEITAAAAASQNQAIPVGKATPKNVQPVTFPNIKTREPATVVKGQARTTGGATAAQRAEAKQTEAMVHSEVDSLRTELQKVRRELEQLPQVDVSSQVQEIKVLLHDLMKERTTKETSRLPEPLSDLQIKLLTAGVSQSFVQNLISELKVVNPPQKNEDGGQPTLDQLKRFYLSQAVRHIHSKFQVTGAWKSDSEKNSILCLVGPTGVGKTTTVAKLATKLKREKNKKIALISCDHYRVAAADQLRVYARILDCPFLDATDENQIKEFILKNRDIDTFLIDTAGRSFRAQDQLNQLKKIADLDLPIQFHMVLSCTMKQRDMDEHIRAFKFLNIQSLIFSKLDESWAYGEILNALMKSQCPLSYLSVGQKVPDDLQLATKERLIEKLFSI